MEKINNHVVRRNYVIVEGGMAFDLRQGELWGNLGEWILWLVSYYKILKGWFYLFI